MSESEKKASKFKFISKNFDSITGKTNRDCLIKWGMRGKLKTFMFTFDEYFHLGQKDKFILDFFQDDSVVSSVQKYSNSGSWNCLGIKAAKVNVQEVDCTCMSVDIFDKFLQKEIARESGSIRKCFDEYYENVLISDELRKALIMEDSDNYDIYSTKERNEFIFRLFKHLAVGGVICQYEDNIQPYIDVTKSIYKDLVSVQKDQKTKKIKVVSYVFKVEVFDENNLKIYPNNTVLEQDFCYMIIDPFKRHIILLYHRFEGPLIVD